ncbi:MAG TPA: hypothetical protein VGG42_09905 [Acidobacteriaceae bacterium]
MFDWANAAATVGAVVVVQVIAHVAGSAAQRQVVKNMQEIQRDHDARLKAHDEEFKALPRDFVPRVELVAQMQSIRESQTRSEMILLRMLLHRAGMGDDKDLALTALGGG